MVTRVRKGPSVRASKGDGAGKKETTRKEKEAQKGPTYLEIEGRRQDDDLSGLENKGQNKEGIERSGRKEKEQQREIKTTSWGGEPGTNQPGQGLEET